jgi:hypothetical protein
MLPKAALGDSLALDYIYIAPMGPMGLSIWGFAGTKLRCPYSFCRLLPCLAVYGQSIYSLFLFCD